MTDQPQRFHVLPTASEPHLPAACDNGDGTFTVYPHLGPENVESNRVSAEANDMPRFHVTPPDPSVNRVAGIHFLGFDGPLCCNRYAAAQLARGLEAAVSIARWLDYEAYNGNWPWAEKGEGQE